MAMKIRAGYSFIEAVVAISILSALIVISLNAITTSADTENINKDFLTAELLAQEGVELINVIYNTNLMKFGLESIDECAFMLPTFTGDTNECHEEGPTNKLTTDNFYTISISPQNGTVLVNRIGSTQFQNDEGEFNDAFRMYLSSFNDTDFFINSDNPLGLSSTKFYRGIEVLNDSQIEVLVGFIRTGGHPTVIRQTFSLN